MAQRSDPQGRDPLKLWRSKWSGFGFLLLLVLLWEAAGRYGWIHELFFPPAGKILVSFVQIMLSGEIFGHIGVSLWRAGLGYILAALIAISLGVLMGYWKSAYEAFELVTRC
ncbi:MAG: hypothetical protein HYV04_00715 [Deltaproteobacteria bacterium]|nr:hypothetical protein [Deltaproteobacteria bacterium]